MKISHLNALILTLSGITIASLSVGIQPVNAQTTFSFSDDDWGHGQGSIPLLN